MINVNGGYCVICRSVAKLKLLVSSFDSPSHKKLVIECMSETETDRYISCCQGNAIYF